MAEALATIDDFLARLGKDLSEVNSIRVDALLKDASAAVRRAAGNQTISLVLNDEIRVRPCGATLNLPQWPVVAVDSIDDEDGNSVEFTWDIGAEVIVYSTAHGHSFERDLVFPALPLTVVYDHGYDPVPDDIIAVVCQVAGRAYGTTPDSAGITQETLGSYSYSIGSAAAAGPMGLLPDERAIAQSYRRFGRPIPVL